MSKKAELIKEEIFKLVEEYYKEEFVNSTPYKEGDPISYGGRVFDEKELINLVDSSLEFWLTSGRYCEELEKRIANYIGVKHALLVNSGSSANLLSIAALFSDSLEERRMNKGDEVITVAAGFPTTVTPIIQFGCIPVFVDVVLGEYNIDIRELEKALSNKTKAVMIAHTLGNPFPLQEVREFCDKHSLWLIEDNCDAFGSEYYYNRKWVKTGSVGDIGTSSFYPAHHITMGEGGAVYTNNPKLNRILLSLRDWGRDCYCSSGEDNSCGNRFTQTFGQLPLGYDHKYVYSHFGYNLKVTEMQASIGLAQIEKVDDFTKQRRDNFDYLYSEFKKANAEKYLILPNKTENSNPSWFGFVISVKQDSPFSRVDITKYLEENKIQTRVLFAGNIIKHPCFDSMRKEKQEGKEPYRVIGELPNTEFIMNNSFWIGVYPGMTKEKLNYMIKHIITYLEKY